VKKMHGTAGRTVSRQANPPPTPIRISKRTRNVLLLLGLFALLLLI
jgi:hypothetical protein